MGIYRKILFTISALLLTSCGFFSDSTKSSSKSGQSEISNWVSEKNKIKICATTPIVADNVRRIGGKYVNVISLMGPEIDPHSYNIVKGDQEKLSQAKIIFANGLSLEHSASMQKMLENHHDVVFVSSSVPDEEIIKINGAPDPHIWMDLSLWGKTNTSIAEALSRIDKEHAEEYMRMAKETKDYYDSVGRGIKKSMNSIPSQKKFLVTSHDAFNYFARAYLAQDGEWQDRVIAIQGLAPEEQISSVEIRRVVDFINKHNVGVIFAEKNLSHDSLYKVIDSCKRKGRKVVLSEDELYGDTLGYKTYIEMMQSNADVINKGLGGDKKGCGCY